MNEFEKYSVSREAVAAVAHRETSGLRFQSAMFRYFASLAVAEDHPTVSASSHGRLWDLDDIPVSTVMTRPVITAEEDVNFVSIVETLVRNRIAAVPVVDRNGVLVGIVSESDLLANTMTRGQSGSVVHRFLGWRKAHADAQAETARQLMTTKVVTTSPDTSIANAARAAARAHVRRLPVVDGGGRPVGMVTGSDLLRVFLRPDEDIRADIVDEMITRRLSVDLSAIDVTVQDGSVTFTGVLERRSLVKQLVDATHRVAGVVAVHNQLHYRADDTLLPASPGPLY